MGDRLKDKVAIVTGASRGIGAGIAIRFAAEGARVVITARTLEEGGKIGGSLRTTADRIRALGGECHIIVANLADPEDRAQIVQGALERFGRTDILVNNAAWARFGMTHKHAAHHVRLAFEVNSIAPLDLASAAIPGMIERGEGWILNISSRTAEHPPHAPYPTGDDRYLRFNRDTGPALYGASKAASERLATGLAAELAPYNIAVNTLSPFEAVASEGAVMVGGIDHWMNVEPTEAMAEAALALCSSPAAQLSGLNAISLTLLEELKRPVRTLDGARELSLAH